MNGSSGLQPFTVPYRPCLDGLRGVAVLMVMLHHSGLIAGGFLGVDIFFVLSGFLITALLLQEWTQHGSVSLGRFYARRALRLLPALIVLLALILLVPTLFGFSGGRPWKFVLVVLLYVANWASALQWLPLGVLSPTWSLAIEEQFYLLWPPLLSLLLALKVRRTAILGLVVLGIIAASVERIVMWDVSGAAAWPRLYWGLDTRMDSLLLGCLVALLAAWGLLPTRGRLAVKAAGAAAAATLLVLAYAAPSPESESLHKYVEPLACWATAILIVALITAPPSPVALLLEDPVLVWIGRISYGLYLWHVPVFHGVLNQARMARLGITGLTLTLLRWALAFGVAAMSFFSIEHRMLGLKDRFRVASLAAPAAPRSVGQPALAAEGVHGEEMDTSAPSGS